MYNNGTWFAVCVCEYVIYFEPHETILFQHLTGLSGYQLFFYATCFYQYDPKIYVYLFQAACNV